MKTSSKLGASLSLALWLSASLSQSSHAATITWVGQGTFTNDTILASAGTVANEVYGVDFFAGTQVTGNGYSFDEFTGGNFALSGSAAGNGNYLSGGGSSGDSALDNVLNFGSYGEIATGSPVTGQLKNLTLGESYKVLVLLADTRGGGTIGRQMTVNDGSTNSPLQPYAFTGGSPAVGGYLLGTFTASASTQAFTIYIKGPVPTLGDQTAVQFNGILLEQSAPPVPEPTTYAELMFGGLVLLGLGRLRKYKLS